mmetsp:Transcript_43652/g.115349  ORF Transcript_43652/g.115349 Transcript_43652/m.115349 type:complete len:227 (-) Transcript_43652:89-769(-)
MDVVASHISPEPGTGATATAARHTNEDCNFSPIVLAWNAWRCDTAPCCCSALLTSFKFLSNRAERECISKWRSRRRCTSRVLTSELPNQPASTSSKSSRVSSCFPRSIIARSSLSKSPSHDSRLFTSSSQCFLRPTGSVLAVCSLSNADVISFQVPLSTCMCTRRASRNCCADSSSSSWISHFQGDKLPVPSNTFILARSSRHRVGTSYRSNGSTPESVVVAGRGS